MSAVALCRAGAGARAVRCAVPCHCNAIAIAMQCHGHSGIIGGCQNRFRMCPARALSKPGKWAHPGEWLSLLPSGHFEGRTT